MADQQRQPHAAWWVIHSSVLLAALKRALSKVGDDIEVTFDNGDLIRIALGRDTHVRTSYFRSGPVEGGRKALLKITDRCDLRCAHCFVSATAAGRGRGPGSALRRADRQQRVRTAELMPSEPFLITVDRPDGVTIRHKVGPVEDADMEMARPFAEKLLALCGGDTIVMCILLVEWLHEQAVYERVCERKGLLPL